MLDVIELKPCPFCGREATIIELPSFNALPTLFASCSNCGAEMPRVCRTREQAIEARNRRANDDKP